MPYVQRMDLHCETGNCRPKILDYGNFFGVIVVEDKPWIADRYGLNIFIGNSRYLLTGQRTGSTKIEFLSKGKEVIHKNHHPNSKVIQIQKHTPIYRTPIYTGPFLELSTGNDMHEQAIAFARKKSAFNNFK